MVYRRITVEGGPPLILIDDNDDSSKFDDDYVPKKTMNRKRKIDEGDDEDDFCLHNKDLRLDDDISNETISLASNRPRRAVTKRTHWTGNPEKHDMEQPHQTSAYGHLQSPLFSLPRELRDQIWGYIWNDFRNNVLKEAIKAGPSWAPESIVAVFPPDHHPDFGTFRGFEDPLHYYDLSAGGLVGWTGDSGFWMQTCRQILEEGAEELKRQAEFIVNLDSKFSNEPEFFTQQFIDASGMKTLWIPRISISLKHLPGHKGFRSKDLRQRLFYSLIFHDADVFDVLADSIKDNQSINTFKISFRFNVSDVERERYWYGRAPDGSVKVLAVGELDANLSPLVPMLKELKALQQLDISLTGFNDANENCDRLGDLCTLEFHDGIQQLADLVLGVGAIKKVENVRMEGNNWGWGNGTRFIFKKA